MRYSKLNTIVTFMNVEFALGKRTTGDLEAQALFSLVNSDYKKELENVLRRYLVNRRIEELRSLVLNSSASVTLAQDGYVRISDGLDEVTYKIRTIDFYLNVYFDINPRHKYYQIVRFYLSFSPFFELLVFNEGIDRLLAKKSA